MSCRKSIGPSVEQAEIDDKEDWEISYLSAPHSVVILAMVNLASTDRLAIVSSDPTNSMA